MIKPCGESDISAVMDFMKHEWYEGHIMANNREFTDYFFRDKKTGNYNVVYALNEQTNEVDGFIAFVPMSFFDCRITPENDFIWVTNWLMSDKAKGGMGIMLYMKMLDVSKCENVGIVGQNKTAEEIYKKMGYKIGGLKHYFINNCKLETDNKHRFNSLDNQQIENIEKFSYYLPKKTARYIINKYLKSPYYKYYARGVSDGKDLCGALIFKAQNYPLGYQKRCVRIVEYFGDPSGLLNKKNEFQALLSEFDADYIDFYCEGIDESILSSAGFVKKEGQLVIPSYFEPFVNENIEIRYAYKLPDNTEKFMVFKGDGDREHPRLGRVPIT